MKKRGAAQATCVVEAGVSLPRKTSGKVILVISGQSRMMYQSLKPEPEGAILSKRSVPQGTDSSPHDAGASMTNWLETNIQGDGSRFRPARKTPVPNAIKLSVNPDLLCTCDQLRLGLSC